MTTVNSLSHIHTFLSYLHKQCLYL